MDASKPCFVSLIWKAKNNFHKFMEIQQQKTASQREECLQTPVSSVPRMPQVPSESVDSKWVGWVNYGWNIHRLVISSTFLYPSIGLSELGKEQVDPNTPTLLQYYGFSKTPMHSYMAVFGLFAFRDRVSGWLQTHVWSSCLSACWCYRSRLPYLAPPSQSDLSFFFFFFFS